MTDLAGKVSLVTGGTSGIGRATAAALAAAGATVVVTGRREAEGAETVRQIAESGGKAAFIAADIADRDQVADLFARIEREFGRLDIAFNNAGVLLKAPMVEATEEDFDLTMSVNVKGVWHALKHELPIMVRQGGGSIVITGSVLGQISTPGMTAYSASKAAIEGMARAAALEVAASGVRINVIRPAIIQTDMTQGAFGGAAAVDAHLGPMHPVGRVGRPEEVAGAVLWLASDAAAFVTGTTINIDGGFTAQ